MQKIIDKITNLLRTNRLLALVIGVGAIALVCFNFKGKETSNDALPALTSSSAQISSVSASGAAVSSTKASSSSKVTIDISGAVKHGGVYTLHTGARLADAIEAAGGLSQRAQIKAINRAQLLNDQDKLYIPFKGEKVANQIASNPENTGSLSSSSSSNSPTSGSNQSGEKINLNTASVSDLQKLSGVGEKRAEQIIAYREQNGGFKKIEDLMQVSGIGEKTFASLKDQLAV